MKYSVVKKLTQALLVASLVLYAAAAVLMNRDADAYALPALIAASAVLVLSAGLRLAWLRCPNCRRYISHRHLRDTHCPFCGKALE